MILKKMSLKTIGEQKIKLCALLSLCHISSTKDDDNYLKIVDNHYFAWENDHQVIKESDTVPKAPYQKPPSVIVRRIVSLEILFCT